VCSQEHPKIFRVLIHRAHRAVSFAIAQLSCLVLFGKRGNLEGAHKREREVPNRGDRGGGSK